MTRDGTFHAYHHLSCHFYLTSIFCRVMQPSRGSRVADAAAASGGAAVAVGAGAAAGRGAEPLQDALRSARGRNITGQASLVKKGAASCGGGGVISRTAARRRDRRCAVDGVKCRNGEASRRHLEGRQAAGCGPARQGVPARPCRCCRQGVGLTTVTSAVLLLDCSLLCCNRKEIAVRVAHCHVCRYSTPGGSRLLPYFRLHVGMTITAMMCKRDVFHML